MTESNAERLEQIDVVHYEEDQDGNQFALLKEDDYWFLKEQAERAQELEGFACKYVTLLKIFWKENCRLQKAFNQLNANREKWMMSHGDLETENARLREVLEEFK